MSSVTIATLVGRRESNTPFSCLTAYDASMARLAEEAGIDVLLIGDSLGMVMQGQSSTLPVTVDDIAYHTRCVARASSRPLIMADLPFMADTSLAHLLEASGALMQAGAHMIKMEGGAWRHDAIIELTQRGVPVCAHLGLTPQHVNSFGGYRIQGRDPDDARRIIDDALDLEQAGAAIILLECVPAILAQQVRDALTVPVIGIGAGPDVDGQILVIQDMLGMTGEKTPRFVKDFLKGEESILEALAAYHEAVISRTFPDDEHCF